MTKNKKKKYYFAGIRVAKKEKYNLLKPLDHDGEDIPFTGRKSYLLGRIFNVKMKGKSKFSFEKTSDWLDDDDERLKEARIAHNTSQTEYRKIKNIKKLKKDRNSLDDVTVAELKEYANQNWRNKERVIDYLLKVL